MLHILIKQIGVACLYLVLSTIEGARTTPSGVQTKALIGTNHLTVSGDPKTGAPLWETEAGKDIPVKATEKGVGSDTGIEPVDEVSKDVPKEWEHFHRVGKALEHLGNPQDAPKEVFVMPKISVAMITQSLLSIFSSMLLTLCCAFAYTRIKEDRRVPLNDGEEHSPNALNRGTWRFGLFDCIHDSKICIISCCCPCIRWSDTMRMAGLMGFWAALILMAFLNAISPITGGITMLVMLCMATYRRQQIRKLFGIKGGDHTSMFEDCCVYCWCSCCAIVQEARQLEEAYAVGYPLQIKEPLRPQYSGRGQMQPLQSQRLDYMPPQPSQRLVNEEPRPIWGSWTAPTSIGPPSSQPLPQPGMMVQQPQVIMSQQPMGSLPPAQMSPQPMGSLPPPQKSPQPMYAQPVSVPSLPPQSLPPQSVQSLPPVQYQQQQFVAGPPVMMGQPLPMGTPPGSMQSMGPTSPTNYQPQ